MVKLQPEWTVTSRTWLLALHLQRSQPSQTPTPLLRFLVRCLPKWCSKPLLSAGQWEPVDELCFIQKNTSYPWDQTQIWWVSSRNTKNYPSSNQFRTQTSVSYWFPPLHVESFSSKPLHDPFQFRLRWKASRDPLEGAHSWHCRQYFPLLAMNLLGFRTYVVDLGLFIVGIKYTHQHLNPYK